MIEKRLMVSEKPVMNVLLAFLGMAPRSVNQRVTAGIRVAGEVFLDA
jgi:hypothetical protein